MQTVLVADMPNCYELKHPQIPLSTYGLELGTSSNMVLRMSRLCVFAGFTTSAVLKSSVFANNAFGKRQQWSVDGAVLAQPLFAPGVLIDGSPTNLLLVATEHSTLYALNAGAGPHTFHMLQGR